MNGVLRQSTLRLRAVTVREPDEAIKQTVSKREWEVRVGRYVLGVADLHGALIAVRGAGVYRYVLQYGKA